MNGGCSLIDENIGYLYNRLADPALSVRKNTLMVLTHLTLNGMVKVKGQIGEMAKCIDGEPRLADLDKVRCARATALKGCYRAGRAGPADAIVQPAGGGVGAARRPP